MTPTRLSPRWARIGLAVVGALLLIAVWMRFYEAYCATPYYRQFDMDLAVTEDTLWVASGRLPQIVVHPGFGLHLLLAPSQRLGAATGALSTFTLSDVAACPNPLAAMAERTSYIRAHSPVLAFGVFALLSLALVGSRPGGPWALVILALVGSQAALVYHAGMIRTELYAVFFWAAAVFLSSVAAGARGERGRGLSLVGVGVMAGLALLTKIQVLFQVAALPLLYLVFRCRTVRPAVAEERPAARRLILVLGLLNVLAFGALLFAAAQADVPEGFMTLASDRRGVQPLGWALLAAFVGLFVVGVSRSRASSRASFDVIDVCILLGTGFLASFLAHFALYADPSQSARYLILDAKMLFAREMAWRLGRPSSDPFSALAGYLSRLPFLFAGHAAALLLLLWRAPRPTRRLVLALSALELAGISLAARPLPRDLLWVELPVNFLTALYLTAARREAVPIFRAAAGLVLLAVLTSTLELGARIGQIATHVDHFRGYQDERWLYESWGHRDYVRLMAERYAPDRVGEEGILAARTQAARHREVRRLVGYVVPTRAAGYAEIGLVARGFPVWRDDPAWLISAFPLPWLGATLVDAAAAAVRRHAFAIPRDLLAEDWLGRRTTTRADEVTVWSRSDLEVSLFVREDDFVGLSEGRWRIEDAPRIVLSMGKRERTFFGLTLLRHQVISVSLSKLNHRFFVVIREDLAETAARSPQMSPLSVAARAACAFGPVGRAC